MTSRLVAIYRHPVKGLRPEPLEEARFQLGNGLEGDRAFAFQFLDESVPEELRLADAESAPWMKKQLLVVQHDWPDLARLTGHYDPRTAHLKIILDDGSNGIEGSVAVAQDRARLSQYIYDFISRHGSFAKAYHPKAAPLRLIGHADRHTRFTDGATGPVSIALRESLRDVEAKFGHSVDERRFRINLFLEGASAWAELGWVGKELRIGSCRLKVVKPIGRCPNIDVNPETGARENEIFPEFKQRFGHAIFGIKAEVLEAGVVKKGDDWEVIP